jgi:hypothetical protein
MLFISPWLGESLAFVTGVVTIFFLVRSKELRQNIWQFLNAPFSKKIAKDKYWTVYLLFILLVILDFAGYTCVDFLYFKNSWLFN